MRVDQQPAYLLHAKKISDSRLLVDCLTRDYGVIGAVARAPSKKKSPLVAFVPASISWLGKTELKTLTSFELFSGHAPRLEGKPLYCGFYLNELLQRLMTKGDECAQLYELYQLTLLKLSLGEVIEPLLRGFEFSLLQAAGYHLDLMNDAASGAPIDPQQYYRIQRNLGVIASAQSSDFLGQHLLAIATNDYRSPEVQQSAKRLSRLLLQPLLGSRPLKSRDLFISMSSQVEKS